MCDCETVNPTLFSHTPRRIFALADDFNSTMIFRKMSFEQQ
jgi:hypothetical protein